MKIFCKFVSDMKTTKNENGRWALVTGASRGIGYRLAEGLAARGYNLVIVARGEEALCSTAELLRGEGVEVVTMVADLVQCEAAQRLYEECSARGLEVEVLVNNAGEFIYRDLCDVEQGRVERIVGLHIATTTTLCRLFARDMRVRGRGYILNMSSYAAWLPLGGLSLYSATKSYVMQLSYALREELREQGVVVTVALPAGVATDLYGLPERYQRVGLRCGVLMSAERVARKCLAGLFEGRRRVVPGVLNRAMLPLLRHLPRPIKRVVRKKTLGFQK